jgi:hypothetical protein
MEQYEIDDLKKGDLIYLISIGDSDYFRISLMYVYEYICFKYDNFIFINKQTKEDSVMLNRGHLSENNVFVNKERAFKAYSEVLKNVLKNLEGE